MDIDEDFVEGMNDEYSDSSEPNLGEEVDNACEPLPDSAPGDCKAWD